MIDSRIRVEHSGGTELLKKIVEAFSDDIDSVTLAKPTLEDVFIHWTGHAFWEGADPEGMV